MPNTQMPARASVEPSKDGSLRSTVLTILNCPAPQTVGSSIFIVKLLLIGTHPAR